MKRKIALALACMLSLPVFAQGGKGGMPLQLRDQGMGVQSLESTSARAVMEKYGKVVDQRVIGAGGLTAWTLEKNGRRVVLYTTPDVGAIISGVVWDAATGQNLSDQFVVKPAGLPVGAATAVPSLQPLAQPDRGALVGPYSGAIPESIKAIDSLAGIKEGKGAAADTLYVIFDPRCSYCRAAYQQTRAYVKRGFSIKWIPAMALGNQAEGIRLGATVLQAKPGQQAEMLRRVLGNKEEITTEPTKASQEALARNLEFFFAAFQNNRVEQAGVPAAFFLDKRTGKPRMMTGVSELTVIEAIFGKL
jgi:thiol:disulfide interchange protein DsbG